MKKPKLRQDLPPLPVNIKRLQIDPDRGYPVPWFVAWHDGKPDFRLTDPAKLIMCIKKNLCFVCGYKLDLLDRAFVAGPLLCLNRTSAEPPSHPECAEFACRACPFLVKPHMERRLGDMPSTAHDGPGVLIKRNPGIGVVWITDNMITLPIPNAGVLFRVGDPIKIICFREGRPATKEEITEAIEEAVPQFRMAVERQGGDLRAMAEVGKMKEEAVMMMERVCFKFIGEQR